MTLPTAAVVRAGWIPSLTGTGEDTTIDLFIARANAVLARWCGFPAVSQSTAPTLEAVAYTHYFDGPSSTDPRLLRLRVRPVSAITSVYVDTTGDFAYSTEVTSGDRVLDDLEGGIRLTPDATSIAGWPVGKRLIKVVYTAGYNTGADAGATTAIGLLVAHWWTGRRMSGLANVTAGDASIAALDGAIPGHVREAAWPLALPEVGIGG